MKRPREWSLSAMKASTSLCQVRRRLLYVIIETTAVDATFDPR
jgi:hypothetical protein